MDYHNPCHYGYAAPAYVAPAYVAPAYYPRSNWFALIVVLFILLIIIGATCYGGK